jgi:serine/threonine protein kinase
MSVITYSEFKSKYRFDCQLSQGSFGRVCRIQENSTRKYYALKKVAVKRKQQL